MSAPVIDPRAAATIEADLRRRLPAFVAGWTPESGGPAVALLQAIARYRSILAAGLNAAPERMVLAGLDAIGMRLAPASPARVPLVFALADDAPLDVTLPEGSQAAAPPAPVAPSIAGGAAAPPAREPIVFATERTITLMRARLCALVSLDPGSDRFADHTTRLRSGFEIFADLEPMEHALYLGHDTLFALGGEIAILIGARIEHGAAASLNLRWEYLADSGWIQLPVAADADTTAGFVTSGQITLTRECGPDAKQETFAGRTSYWLRARARTPVTAGTGALPLVVNDLTARVRFSKRGLLPEAAFADVAKLDVTKAFRPFGPLPARFSTFYVASTEVFQRGGAQVTLQFTIAVGGTAQDSLTLVWEYSSADGWQGLTVTPEPSGASAFTFAAPAAGSAPAQVQFACPADWAEVDVNGTTKRWLRVRILTGNYGQALHIDTSTTPPTATSNLAAPVVARLALSFEYMTESSPLDHCLSFNDFVFADHTDACRWPDLTFSPFRASSESAPSVQLGFDAPLPVGLVSLYVDVPSAGVTTPPVSPYVWEYCRAEGWAELGVLDETAGFLQSGMLQFIGPRDATRRDGLGGSLYRVRARLKQGETAAPSRVAGLWTNGVWGAHRRRVERELLGLGDGTSGATLRCSRTPVLEGEIVEVREWTGRGTTWRTALPGVVESDLRFDRDPVTQEPTAAWVRWQERPHLHDSAATDRHYTLERATGRLRFGAGVPAAGRRIVASYLTGGGLAGDVAAASVRELRVAIPFIDSVVNPVPAQGGAEAESMSGVLARAAQRLRHRDRALSCTDYEWLARDASPEVARACCAPLLGADGHAIRGAVTLALAPISLDAWPSPSPELARRVHAHISVHAPAGVVLRVVPATYVPVSVLATLAPVDPSMAAAVEARVRESLNRFLHPLAGGPAGAGWAFGQSVHLSQIAAVIEGTPGVDYTTSLIIECEGAVVDGVVRIPADALVAAGQHELTLRLGAR